MRWGKILLLFIAAVVTAAAVFFYWVFYGGNTYYESKKIFFVSKGQNWDQVVDSLASQGVVRSKEWFIFVSRVLYRSQQVHVGKYEFPSGVSNVEVGNMIRQGRGIVPVMVTLREGRRNSSFARSMSKSLGIDSSRFMQLVTDTSFIRSLNIPAKSLEGYLAPDTYEFQWQTDEQDIIRRLVRQTERNLDAEVVALARARKLTIHQVLTLASIIEGEAVDATEREVVSGVYHNRLRRGMRLEADPTIQYIIPNGPRRIYYSDLKIKSPYNTYRNYGLPPGPIGNPGKASILAAVNPAKHNYVFFVANGKGGHWFANTYQEHLRNARRFRQVRENQVRTMGQI